MDRRKLLKAGVGLAGFVLAAPLVARAEGLTLRFAHFVQEDHPASIAAMQFARRVEKRTDGAVKIEIAANSQLGSPDEQAKQISAGAIDMGLPTQGHLQKFDKAFGAVPLPFIFDSAALAYRVLDGPGMDWLAPLAEAQGFIMLRNWDYGFRNVTNSVRPINAPDDVKGLKLRTPPELQIQASMEALGATVQAIPLPQLNKALADKVVDGEENPISVIYFSEFYKTQKYLALTRHIYNNMIHTISVGAWKKLTPEQQTIFREESVAAGDLMRRLINEGEKAQTIKLINAGMQLTVPDLAPFRALMEPAYKRIASFAGEDNVTRFRDMVEQVRKA